MKRPKKSKQYSVVDGDPALDADKMSKAQESEWTDYSRSRSYAQKHEPTLAVEPLPADAPLARDVQADSETAGAAQAAPTAGVSEAAPAPDAAQESMPAGMTAEAVAPAPSEPVRLGDQPDEDRGDVKEFKHKGFVAEIQGGAMGCTGAICSGSTGHNAGAGARFDGFVGGNIGGIFEVGLAGGWGKMTPKVVAGTNALNLYGLDVPDIPPELLDGFELESLNVTSAKLDDLRVGPALRVHFVRKGRMQAFVGTGFGYHRFRGQYGTASGNATLAFHGIDVPVQGGLGVHVTERLSMGLRFDYLWTYFGAVSVKHPSANMVAPLGYLDQQLEAHDRSLMDNLPKFWTASLAMRLTL